MRRTTLVGFCFLSGLFSATARADIVPYGDGESHDSWSQSFWAESTGANNGALIDLFAVRMVTVGDAFEHTPDGNPSTPDVAMDRFTARSHGTPNGWSTVYNTATMAVAVGTPIESFNFFFNFEGDYWDNPFSFEVLMLSDRDFTNSRFAPPGEASRILYCATWTWTPNSGGPYIGRGSWSAIECPVGTQPWMTRDELANLMVPTPESALLGVIGLAATACFRRRAL